MHFCLYQHMLVCNYGTSGLLALHILRLKIFVSATFMG